MASTTEPFSVPGIPLTEDAVHGIALRNKVPVSQVCVMCGKVIVVQIFKNSGVCCEQHRKDRDNDHAPFRGGSLAP